MSGANTRARVATLCQAWNPARSVADNHAEILRRLELAWGHKPDLVCLPETFNTAGVSGAADALAESVPGPTLDLFAAQARRHRCYIVCPLLTRRDGRIWNSAVLLDRTGAIAGIYDKVHLPTSTSDFTEFDGGCTPGTATPVFDLDFGRIGIQICFDAIFADGWAELARQGARLVVWSSAYNGGFPLQAYTCLHRYYVVSSVRPEKSQVIDPCGTVLAATDCLNSVIVRDINLDYAVCHYDFNYGIPDRIHAAYPGQVEIRSHWDAARFLVEPLNPAITIARLQKEFGFSTIEESCRFHEHAYPLLRRGETPRPQAAPHGNGPQHAKV